MVERTVVLPASIQEVWTAITTPHRLSEWFGGTVVELELRPGGRVVVQENATTRRAVVQSVEPPRLLTFRWLPVQDGPGGYVWAPASTVELVLTEEADGTRLTVRESTSRWVGRDPRLYARVLVAS
jgi:uncharacterized protein YndB with AHSA1/START domain